MKAILLMSLLAVSFNIFADDELPMIEDQADEEALSQAPSNEPEPVAAAPVASTEVETVAPVTQPATASDQVIDSAPINVDGVVKERPVVDHELQGIRAEIQKQKKEIVLNKVKAQQFKQLSKYTEALSETTEEMLAEKRAAQEEIAAYNLKVKCMSSDNAGPECDKFNRKRR